MGFTNEEILVNKIKQYKKKVSINAFFCIIFIPIVLYSIFLMIQSVVIEKEIPHIAGYKVFTLKNENMTPSFNVNDVLLIKKVKREDIKVNDIIAFRNNENIEIARIKMIQNGNKFLVGTDKEKEYKTLDYSQIEGMYKTKILYISDIVSFLEDKIFMISILLIIYVLYINGSKKEEKSMIRAEKRKMYDKLYKNKINN